MQATATVTDLQEIGDRQRRLFEELALPLRDDLYRAALSLTQNDADAEDLVQETYLRVLRFVHRFQEGTNFWAWIFTMLRNLFIDGYRKNRRQPVTVDPEIIELTTVDENQGKELERYVGSRDEAEIRDMFDADVYRALDSLPRNFRRVLLLFDIAGFNYKEIAKIVDCPIGTVRSRICRARQRLKEQLHELAA